LTKCFLPLQKRILIIAIVFTMIIAISTKVYADEAQTTSEKRMPSAKLTPSDNAINLNEKNTVEFTFSTNPPTPDIPVYIQISPNFVDWPTLKQGLTGSDGTFKASYTFERPGSIDCRALWDMGKPYIYCGLCIADRGLLLFSMHYSHRCLRKPYGT
jgi:hypothetical protein